MHSNKDAEQPKKKKPLSNQDNILIQYVKKKILTEKKLMMSEKSKS